VLFYPGNDNAAKVEVAALIDQIGGKLAQFPGGPLPNQNLIKIS